METEVWGFTGSDQVGPWSPRLGKKGEKNIWKMVFNGQRVPMR